MTNQKSTKRALLTSVLALLVCVTMLIGSTFAWFTDTANSGRNKIVSGNLDVELYFATPADYAAGNWTEVTSTTKLFDDAALYEPGYTELVYLKVKNAGTLALKYDMNLNFTEKTGINVYGDEFKLSDYIKARVIFEGEFAKMNLRENVPYFDIGWYKFETGDVLSKFDSSASNTTVGWDETALLAGEEIEVALALWMDTKVGNEANYMTGTTAPSIDLGVDLVATQYSYEEDTFGNDYDENAKYPELPAADVTKLDAVQIATIGALDILNDAGSDTYTLDTGYAFKTEDKAKNIESNPYKYWNVDYVISFDKAVPANSVALAGAYESFANGAWLAFTNPMAIAANEELRLLESAVDFTSFASNPIFVNYGEIVSNVGEFQCGATDINNALAGTTITVELRMYETAPADKNADNSHNNETGAYKVIDTVTYTF